MEQRRFADLLPELREELKQAQRRLMTAQNDVEALEKALSGLEYFFEPRQVQLPVTTAHTNGAAGDAPRGREAVRRVMAENGGPMKAQAVIQSIRSRGWIDPDARDPDASIRVAIRRLAESGEVRKIGTGVYQHAVSREEEGAKTEA